VQLRHADCKRTASARCFRGTTHNHNPVRQEVPEGMTNVERKMSNVEVCVNCLLTSCFASSFDIRHSTFIILIKVQFIISSKTNSVRQSVPLFIRTHLLIPLFPALRVFSPPLFGDSI